MSNVTAVTPLRLVRYIICFIIYHQVGLLLKEEIEIELSRGVFNTKQRRAAAVI